MDHFAALEACGPPADTAPPPVDLPSVRARLKANRAALAGYFSAERADIFLALDACALARHHAFLGGPAGLAKSLLVETWAGAFAAGGAVYRRELLTRQSTEADVLAYLDVPAFAREGLYRYRVEGKIVEGHFAFLDESFKATGSLLNALLTWLNERTVRGGYVSPLVSCVGASNEFPEDDSTAALEDRFLVRFWLAPLSAGARLDFLRGRADGRRPPVLASVTLAELEAAQRDVAALPVDDAVLVALGALVDALAPVGVYVSDRRIGWCVEILRAVAWLDGADTVDVDHLDFLRHVLWKRPTDKPVVEAALATVDRGVIGEVRRICEAALAAYHERSAAPDWHRQAHATADRIAAAAQEIQERFRGKVPDRLAGRIRGYLAELATAHRASMEVARTL
jgi:MoxR-like ATPase